MICGYFGFGIGSNEVTSDCQHGPKFMVVLENLKNLNFFRGHDILFFGLIGWSDVCDYVGIIFFPLISQFWSGRWFSLHGSMNSFGPLPNTRVWPVKERRKFCFLDLQLDLQPRLSRLSKIQAKMMNFGWIWQFFADFRPQMSKIAIFKGFLPAESSRKCCLKFLSVWAK